MSIMDEELGDTTTGGTGADDAEQQQFLNIGQYKPEDVAKVSTPTTNTSINSNIVTNPANPQDGHAHPTSAFFTVIFKAASVLLYCFGSWFSDNFVLVFVLVILTLAADFWAVKNVTGRLLVGLRWWNEVSEDGTTEWRFESKADTRIINKRDSNLFWSSLYLTPVIWFLLALAAIMQFSLKWLPLTAVGLALNSAQLFGYWKCQRDQTKKIQNLIQAGLTEVGVGVMQQQLKQSFSQPPPTHTV